MGDSCEFANLETYQYRFHIVMIQIIMKDDIPARFSLNGILSFLYTHPSKPEELPLLKGPVWRDRAPRLSGGRREA